MGKITSNSSNKFRTVWGSFHLSRPFSFTVAGTFNGTAYVAAGTSDLFDRYYFNSYVDASKVVTQYETVLPNNYKAGTSIKIRLIWSSLATTGNVKFQVGLTQLNGSNVYDGESSAEYLTTTKAANSNGTDYKALDGGILTFSGTNLLAGEDIGIVVTRDPTDAADTLAATAYIQQVILYYQTESIQSETGKIRKMTPALYPVLYRTINVHGAAITGNAGTFNGLTCVASSGISLNSRWRSAGMADAAKTAGTFSIALPTNFVAGSNIVVEVSGYSSGASTANLLLGVGISKTALDTAYVGEAGTTYVTAVTPLVAAFNKVTQTFSFSTTGFVAGDILGIVVYREGDNASDSATTTWRVINVAVRVPIDKNGIETVV